MEARLVRLARCAWIPDGANGSARTFVRCPWHASEFPALVIGATRSRTGMYPTYWHCMGCRRCGLARLDGDNVRLDWDGVVHPSQEA